MLAHADPLVVTWHGHQYVILVNVFSSESQCGKDDLRAQSGHKIELQTVWAWRSATPGTRHEHHAGRQAVIESAVKLADEDKKVLFVPEWHLRYGCDSRLRSLCQVPQV